MTDLDELLAQAINLVYYDLWQRGLLGDPGCAVMGENRSTQIPVDTVQEFIDALRLDGGEVCIVRGYDE